MVLAVVLPGEADLPVGEPHQAAVGDGNTMGVAAEIAEHLLRPGERRLGVDDPLDPGQGTELGGKGDMVSQGGERAGEPELTIGESGS